MQTVYKVVRRSCNGQLISAWVNLPSSLNPSAIGLVYPLGEWTYPSVPNSYLLAFETYRAAEKWKNCMVWDSTEIWRAVARKTRPAASNFLTTKRGTTREDTLAYWNSVRRGTVERFIEEMAARQPMPAGSLFCSSLKLIERA